MLHRWWLLRLLLNQCWYNGLVLCPLASPNSTIKWFFHQTRFVPLLTIGDHRRPSATLPDGFPMKSNMLYIFGPIFKHPKIGPQKNLRKDWKRLFLEKNRAKIKTIFSSVLVEEPLYTMALNHWVLVPLIIGALEHQNQFGPDLTIGDDRDDVFDRSNHIGNI